MDIRDIKDEVIYPGVTAFRVMFGLQTVLLDSYIGIESLPPYPIDINTKGGQALIKDFIGRAIEELGEAFESYMVMMDMFHHGASEEDMVTHLQNFNEEISDTLHFWLELMVYSGYGEIKIIEWMETYAETNTVRGQDPLDIWFRIGNTLVGQEVAHKKIPCRWVIKDDDLDDEFLRGGRQLGNTRMNIMKQYLWDTTYHLQMVRNTLKNKPWKQTGMMTDEKKYEESMKNAMVSFFKFLSFTGFTKESLYLIYYKKNRINRFRINSKY